MLKKSFRDSSQLSKPISSEILKRIKHDLELDESDSDFIQLKNADNPQKIHEALFTASDIGQHLSKETIRQIYDHITVPSIIPKTQWRGFAPFCHGTSEENAKKIKTEGLKPRLLTGESQWEESGIASMPDRSYVGINSDAGLEKCFEAMLNASDSIPSGDIFFFDESIVENEPVADEDCLKEKPFMNAFESADQCASFGLRKPISPKKILGHISFEPYDVVQSADQMCQFLDKGKNNNSYMEYGECMEVVKRVYDNHGMDMYDKDVNRSLGKKVRIGKEKYRDMRYYL